MSYQKSKINIMLARCYIVIRNRNRMLRKSINKSDIIKTDKKYDKKNQGTNKKNIIINKK